MYRDVSGIEAQGADRLERVSFFSKGTAHTLEAATLLYHGGVIPRTHMANALDLPHHWDARQQCWTVACDGCGRTAREGVYVARGLQPRTRCRRRWDSGRTGGSGRGGAAGRHRAGGIQAAQRTPVAFPCRTDGIQGFSGRMVLAAQGSVCRAGRRSRVPLRERQRGGYPGSRPRRPDRHQRSKAAHAAGDGAIARAGPAARLWRPLRRKPRAGPYPTWGACMSAPPCGPCRFPPSCGFPKRSNPFPQP